MSYSEKDGAVILTMSREDYELTNGLLRFLEGFDVSENQVNSIKALLDRLNSGNPNYTPCEVSPSPSCTPNAPPRSTPDRP
jgi:hypothetical protein